MLIEDSIKREEMRFIIKEKVLKVWDPNVPYYFEAYFS